MYVCMYVHSGMTHGKFFWGVTHPIVVKLKIQKE